ncbi:MULTISPECIES: branched-chain amino acid ABC transporter permease [Brevibacillus]|uniref:Branched-chain amino acid ABC transporter permease n=1 Tax=Brevibacillus invocatus TaxID=173959 RepID=A0A3M8C9B0_9BACL|nr:MULTISPECIES: branched-chain amino acid ABC transporter permease [Brevibacillus]MCM3081246.1 branched-chain amino acid ABC transporter permease [Brevibacillus invocatus]MCM3431593.1 branched-chain amino acid ABC transporter permease [Brevibacillus invocatus]MDH4616706.1 branched-chain amino acid ABC transporter permease [Brevibacillus sp. AY1]RNB72296.1 branched-chain amino acid ABC transporter permease [Brevibacillus invocatus]
MKTNWLVSSRLWMGMAAILLIGFPFVSDSRSALILLTQIFIYAVFAMSYDILLGYTGIISFGHAMFFGIGAYTTAIFLHRWDHTMLAFLVSLLVVLVLTGIVSYLIGVMTLRLKSHFYAMLTLAVAGLFLVLAEKWRDLTKGSDGFTFYIPDVLKDRTTLYFASFFFMIIMFFLLKRFTDSPTGKVLQAIRENEQRTESLGYQILHYKIIASVVAGLAAGMSGSMYAITLRFVNTAVFGTNVTLDALLMTIVGGVGTLFGSIVGSALILLVHAGLTDLAKIHWIFERWMIFFGALYILAVMFFPQGVVGMLRQWKEKWKRA